MIAKETPRNKIILARSFEFHLDPSQLLQYVNEVGNGCKPLNLSLGYFGQTALPWSSRKSVYSAVSGAEQHPSPELLPLLGPRFSSFCCRPTLPHAQLQPLSLSPLCHSHSLAPLQAHTGGDLAHDVQRNTESRRWFSACLGQSSASYFLCKWI